MSISIEPELNYCLQCREEYRSEIERCAHCQTPLVRGNEILRKEKGIFPVKFVAIEPGDPLVPVRKGAVLQIKQLKSLLKDAGFDSLVSSEPEQCGKGCCGGAEVLLEVRETDLEGVIAVLAREHEATTGLDGLENAYSDEIYNPDADEATCPACGYTFSTSSTCCPECGLCFA